MRYDYQVTDTKHWFFNQNNMALLKDFPASSLSSGKSSQGDNGGQQCKQNSVKQLRQSISSLKSSWVVKLKYAGNAMNIQSHLNHHHLGLTVSRPAAMNAIFTAKLPFSFLKVSNIMKSMAVSEITPYSLHSALGCSPFWSSVHVYMSNPI